MNVTEVISRNLKRYRHERGLSLGQLSARCGLAKQTIHAVEAGNSNPTVETLQRLADGLEIGIRALLSELGTEMFIQPADAAHWRPRSGASVRHLDQSFGSGYVTNAVLRLRRDDPPFECPARGRGVLRHCYVLEGRARVGPDSDLVLVSAGDFVRFPGDAPHRFEARSVTASIFVNTTTPQLTMTGGGRDL